MSDCAPGLFLFVLPGHSPSETQVCSLPSCGQARGDTGAATVIQLFPAGYSRPGSPQQDVPPSLGASAGKSFTHHRQGKQGWRLKWSPGLLTPKPRIFCWMLWICECRTSPGVLASSAPISASDPSLLGPDSLWSLPAFSAASANTRGRTSVLGVRVMDSLCPRHTVTQNWS